MPKRRRSSKKKKRGRRPYPTSKRKPKLTRYVLGGFPSRSKPVKLRYTQLITLSPPLGGIANSYFTANGAYDPWITGVGHQPRGFDQWMTWYDHYTVLSSRCSMKYLPVDSTLHTPGQYGILASDVNVFNYSTIDGITEGVQRKSKITFAGGQNESKRVVSVGTSQKTENGSRNLVGIERYMGSSVANPTEQSYYWCFYGSPDALNQPAPATFTITIDYIMVFTERKFVIAS